MNYECGGKINKQTSIRIFYNGKNKKKESRYHSFLAAYTVAHITKSLIVSLMNESMNNINGKKNGKLNKQTSIRIFNLCIIGHLLS